MHGVLDERGVLLRQDLALPCVTTLIVGEPIRGSWWGHPENKWIYDTLERLEPETARVKLLNEKVTLVHRRLWPVLFKLQSRIPPSRIAVLDERHTPSGKHEVTAIPLSEWAGADVESAASRLDVEDALRTLEAIAPLRSMLDA